MNVPNDYKKEYWNGNDFEIGVPCQCMITGNVTEEETERDGKKVNRLVAPLSANGLTYLVSFNKTSVRALIQAFGDNTDDWEDKQLMMYPTPQVVRGKDVISLFIKPKK